MMFICIIKREREDERTRERGKEVKGEEGEKRSDERDSNEMTWGQREKIQGMNFQFSMESFQINENKKSNIWEK